MADIVLLFRRNPMLIDCADNIASRIGRKGESVERDLKKLARLGVLDAEKIGKKTWFGFDVKRDKEIQGVIKNYIRSCAETV
jgi:predicted transcriptional regulator